MKRMGSGEAIHYCGDSGTHTVKLLCADSLKGMQELPIESIDVIVTSPPYNIGIAYTSYHDQRPRPDYLAWIAEFGRACARCLSNDGSLFLNVGNRPSDPWLAWDVAREVQDSLKLQNVILWVKSIAISKEDVGKASGVLEDIAVGHYKPIVSNRFLHACSEFIFHFSKSGAVKLDRLANGVPYQDKTNIGRWKSAKQDLRCRGNVWFIPYETIFDQESQRPHPATFPSKLPEMCIRLHGIGKTCTVLDPFVGIGSTPVACVRLGVDCIGYDIDPEYLRVAFRRVQTEATGRHGGSQCLPGRNS